MSANLTAESIALLVIAQVNVDIKAETVPSTVRTFAELHDYVDANEYLISVFEAAEVELDSADQDQADLMNEAMELVSVWLNVRFRKVTGTTPAAGRHS